MILNGKKTRHFTANLLADFILSNIDPDKNTRIQVTDVGKFYVINGKTESDERLNLSLLAEEFNELFSNLISNNVVNTIDLIDYNSKLEEPRNLNITLYDTPNCLYSEEQLLAYNENSDKSYDFFNQKLIEIDEKFLPSISSSKPHGYSSLQYRALLNYVKHIYYNLRTDCLVGALNINVSLDDFEPKVEIFNFYSNERDVKLESVVLDYFNFDMSEMINITNNSKFIAELLFPEKDNEQLKEIVPDLFIF